MRNLTIFDFSFSLTTKSIHFTVAEFQFGWSWSLADHLTGGPTRRNLHIYHDLLGYITITGKGIEIAKSDGYRPPSFRLVYQRGEGPWQHLKRNAA